MTTDTALVLTLLVLCYAVVSGLVKQWYLAPALVFMIVGMALGRSASTCSRGDRTPPRSPFWRSSR